MTQTFDKKMMTRALALAERGRGAVEPNPMVGCVLVSDDEIIAEGWHRRFGEAHAEVDAIAAATQSVKGCTAYVTLEPCCHTGKTPPCSTALTDAGISRVVIAGADPFSKVDGGGITQLRAAGIDVTVGLLESTARHLNAPYLKLIEQGKPWVIAKWAMTLDGKIATATHSSQWISNERSREIVHRIRGRVDAVIVGKGTALADDPRLTARPPGPRQATRIVLDSRAELPTTSHLATTAKEQPVIIVTQPYADRANVQRLKECGCEVLVCSADSKRERIEELLNVLGKRKMTNVLIEGGSELLGQFFDAGQIDEVHVFIAPKIVGGRDALTPVGGHGLDLMSKATQLENLAVEMLDGDVYLHGRLQKGC